MFIKRFFYYWPFLGKLNYLIIFIKDKNGEGEITSHFTLIDTGLYGTYFWVVKTCLLTNKSSNTLLVCISNTLDDVGEGVVSLYKKPLVLEALFWFYWIKCFLVSTVSVKLFIHTSKKKCDIFLFRGRGWVILLIYHIYLLRPWIFDCFGKQDILKNQSD